MKCDECDSTEFVKNGSKRYRDGKHQMYQCTGCGASKKGEVLEPLPKGKVVPDRIAGSKGERKLPALAEERFKLCESVE